jgi:hypothetical protein
MRTEDGHIIRKCLNGEPEAFGFLVDKYKESVYAFAYAKLDSIITNDKFCMTRYGKLKLSGRRRPLRLHS